MHPSAQKVANAARDLGLDIKIVEFAQTTRSAQEAADAIGCDVDQIVKSLCFSAHEQPIMALVSGANQLDTRKLAGLLNVSPKKIRRANADIVKEATGFSIGGVPPFGHKNPLPIYIDADLMGFDIIWAAAGTPFAVFAIEPEQLVKGSNGQIVDLKMA